MSNYALLENLRAIAAQYGAETPAGILVEIENLERSLGLRSDPQPTEQELLKKRLNALKLNQARHGINTDPAVIIEIEDIERKLNRPAPPRPNHNVQATRTEVEHQWGLLKTHRGNLNHYLKQAEYHGSLNNAPPIVRNGIEECRRNIARVKAILRSYGEHVIDFQNEVDQ